MFFSPYWTGHLNLYLFYVSIVSASFLWLNVSYTAVILLFYYVRWGSEVVGMKRNLGFVFFGTYQQGVPVTLKELIFLGGFHTTFLRVTFKVLTNRLQASHAAWMSQIIKLGHTCSNPRGFVSFIKIWRNYSSSLSTWIPVNCWTP